MKGYKYRKQFTNSEDASKKITITYKGASSGKMLRPFAFWKTCVLFTDL